VIYQSEINMLVNNIAYIIIFCRFYLGLALALKKDGPGARVKEGVLYLLEAFETLMTERTKQAMSHEPER
jgi:hypothetical protein